MTTDRIKPLEALLTEAEAAHGLYETTELNGVYDESWPRWYATYAVDHGIGDILGRAVRADELAALLTTGWAEYEAADPPPADPWARHIAGRLVAQFTG